MRKGTAQRSNRLRTEETAAFREEEIVVDRITIDKGDGQTKLASQEAPNQSLAA